MNPLLLAQLLAQVAEIGFPLIMKIKADIDSGRTVTTVSDADLAEAHRLNSLRSAQINTEEGLTRAS